MIKVQKRDGRIVNYDREKIVRAIQKANAEVDAAERAGEALIDGKDGFLWKFVDLERLRWTFLCRWICSRKKTASAWLRILHISQGGAEAM